MFLSKRIVVILTFQLYMKEKFQNIKGIVQLKHLTSEFN